MDPVLELQGAVINRLRSHGGVQAIVAQRAYDIPPLTPAREILPGLFPYISLGPCTYTTEAADCIYGGEVTIQIDAWSTYPGNSEVRRMAAAIRAALMASDIVLAVNALVTMDHLRTDFITDGLVRHASVQFAATVEEP